MSRNTPQYATPCSFPVCCVLAAWMVLCSTPTVAVAEDVCGPIYEDTIWTAANSPYVLTCDVVVFGGATLTIEPAVEVRFQPGTTLIAQDGTILALGMPGLRISFVSDDPQNPGAGVRLRANFGAAAQFENCDFSNFDWAIKIDCCGSGTVPVIGCRFLGNQTALAGYGIDVVVTDTLFENNTYAATSGSKSFSNCVFRNNDYGIQAQSTQVFDSSFEGHQVAIATAGLVADCTITNNQVGVESYSGLPRLRGNAITDNDIGVEGFYSLTENTITRNRIGVIVTGYNFSDFGCNDIFGNAEYNAVMQTDVSIFGQDNWWGTLDFDQIGESIWDGFDEPNLGFMVFDPWLTTPWAQSYTCGCRPSWTQVADSGPSAREGHAMAYDSDRGVTVLFGGNPGADYVDDTWEWDGTTWTLVAETGASDRAEHAMAYDSGRGVTVLFGGYGWDGELGDTWEWNGPTWTQVATFGPSARSGHAMAYDSARGVTVLFGGYAGGVHVRGTWEWDGSTWTLVGETGPADRAEHAMAYDSDRGVTVLFGGYGASLFGDTWEWDGSTWTQVADSGPSPRSVHAMAYDSDRGVTVLFGDNGGLAGTWEWDGSTWTQVAETGPGDRAGHAIAYDSARGLTVLFGGYYLNAETWEWDGPRAAPSITQQPRDQIVAVGDPAVFSVTAVANEPLTYQWRKDAVDLVDGERISGTTTDTLTIDPVEMADAGEYDVVVSISCGGITSDLATLTVDSPCEPCDMNCDGDINAFDIEQFLELLFGGGRPCATCTGDVNADGNVDAFDIEPFLNCLFP